MKKFSEYINEDLFKSVDKGSEKLEKKAKDIIYDIIYGNMIVTAKGDPKQIKSIMFSSDFKINIIQYFSTKFSADTFEMVQKYIEKNYKFTDTLKGRWKGVAGDLDIEGEKYHISMGNKGQKQPYIRIYIIK